jgi:hypothetical protein
MKTFFDALNCLAEIVHKVIVPEQLQGNDTLPIALTVRNKLSIRKEDAEEMADTFLTTARDLLNSGSLRLMNAGESISVEKAEHLYVELLAGACLGLYFLGVPLGQPWDKVLRWVESDGGGLPNGVCVAKAIGDLVRAERNSAENSNLLVRTYLPIVLFRELIREGAIFYRPPAEEDCPLQRASESAGILGRCYELLQICLYVRGGRSISYVVPRSLIQKLLGITTTFTLPEVRARWDQMCEWLDYVFQTPDVSCQHVCIIGPVGLPACFVNQSSGLFTFEPITDAPQDARDFPLPASYMRSGRRLQYLNQLQAERDYAVTQGNLLSPEARHNVLENLLRPD